MALADIIFYAVVAEADRGNVGVIENTTADHHTLFVTIPLVTQVENGIIFGGQNSLVGTFAGGGGGGPTYFAYG